MSSSPVLSVIIPCYNGGSTFSGMLESLVSQTWKGPWEVIIADNGSTDGSVTTANLFKHRLPIRVVDASSVPGASHARNRGVEEARGKYIIFCDTDDVLDSAYIDEMVDAMKNHPYVGGNIRYDKVNPEWAHGKEDQHLGENGLCVSHHLPFVAGGMIGVHRDVCESVGGFDEALPRLQDMDFGWRVQEQLNIKPICVQGAYVYYRGRSITKALPNNFNSARNYFRIISKHGHEEKVTNGDSITYIRRELRSLIAKLVKTVRSSADLNLWILSVAWRLGIVYEVGRALLRHRNIQG